MPWQSCQAMSEHSPWWREAAVYEVYIRSFADANGDGIGDLAGVRSRLTYLRDLGVDALWLTPFYPSPQADHGYDVSDYCDVDPMFGTLRDFDDLVTAAHRLGIRVIIDVVPNHTSDQHPWFRAAAAAGPGAPERARYHFRPGRGPDGADPPNNWRSMFGGSAWTRLPDGEWYLHLFDTTQPDLNWTDPGVRAAFDDVLTFWLERGVDGLRIDVAGGLVKHPEYAELSETEPVEADSDQPARTAEDEDDEPGAKESPHPHWDRAEVHEIYRRWNEVLSSYPGDRMAVAEVWGDPESVAAYARRDELQQVFAFALLNAPWSASELRRIAERFLRALSVHGRLPAWVLSSHDFVRPATRYSLDRARALTLTMLALPGAMYLYQGDELGLPEVQLPDGVLQDPTFLRSGGAERGRDGCRVPMPWQADAPAFGFSPTPGAVPGALPWLPQPPEWADLAADRQEQDPTSTLSLVRAALSLRKELWVGAGPDVHWLDEPAGCVAFVRDGGAVCVLNAGDRPVRLPRFGGFPLLASGVLVDDALPPATAVWLSGV